jgi:hypothetical protein
MHRADKVRHAVMVSFATMTINRLAFASVARIVATALPHARSVALSLKRALRNARTCAKVLCADKVRMRAVMASFATMTMATLAFASVAAHRGAVAEFRRGALASVNARSVACPKRALRTARTSANVKIGPTAD